jgi:excisionase family DNA binding protein
MNKQPSVLLSVQEFADALNITVACARRWVLERKITTVKLGRLIRIPASEVERLVNSGLRPARSSKAVNGILQVGTVRSLIPTRATL